MDHQEQSLTAIGIPERTYGGLLGGNSGEFLNVLLEESPKERKTKSPAEISEKTLDKIPRRTCGGFSKTTPAGSIKELLKKIMKKLHVLRNFLRNHLKQSLEEILWNKSCRILEETLEGGFSPEELGQIAF